MLVDPSQSSHHLYMLSLTNSHGVGGGTCLSVVSCPCCRACRLCIRVRCMHGTVQVSSFHFQPKGEGKAHLHAASIVFITAGRGSYIMCTYSLAITYILTSRGRFW